MWNALIQFDRDLLLALNGSWGEGWDQFWFLVSGKTTWIPLYALILVLLWRRYGWKQTLLAALFVGVGIAFADHICNIFKHGFEKLRPTRDPAIADRVHHVGDYMGGLYGTFSAHAATVFTLIRFTIPLVKSRIYTWLMIFWGLLVCYSRIYLGVHFPADILFGTLTGILVGWAMYRLYKLFLSKYGGRFQK